MESPHEESLEAGIYAMLDNLDKAHLELGRREVFEAFGGAMYGMDLLAAGALNRSKAHIAGFRDLVQVKNLICAGALLRLQLDTALRFHAAFLVEQPHEFAVAVLGGERVRNLKDRDGKKMTDAYLVEKLGREFDWVPRVYERSSGYVHLSATHLLSAMGPTELHHSEQSISIRVGSRTNRCQSGSALKLLMPSGRPRTFYCVMCTVGCSPRPTQNSFSSGSTTEMPSKAAPNLRLQLTAAGAIMTAAATEASL